MTVPSRLETERRFAIVDMLRRLPSAVIYAAIDRLPNSLQLDLHDFLHAAVKEDQ